MKLISIFGKNYEYYWEEKEESDTVNPTSFYYLKCDDLDLMSCFPLVMKLMDCINVRMADIFPRNSFKLWECFVQKYSKEKSVGHNRDDGALIFHVDGNEGVGDIASVVYTMHEG